MVLVISIITASVTFDHLLVFFFIICFCDCLFAWKWKASRTSAGKMSRRWEASYSYVMFGWQDHIFYLVKNMKKHNNIFYIKTHLDHCRSYNDMNCLQDEVWNPAGCLTLVLLRRYVVSQWPCRKDFVVRRSSCLTSLHHQLSLQGQCSTFSGFIFFSSLAIEVFFLKQLFFVA